MPADHASVRDAIRGYLDGLNGRGDPLADGDDIIARGHIASIQLLDLINYVAETWQVEIEEAHVFDGHFATVDSIVGFVVARAAA
ncbi:MAG TPA: hypothetical protein VL172_18115 [Kofleriaceae bacterium]|nr:hypothetical protein [Kofleriaceae bacterium]